MKHRQLNIVPIEGGFCVVPTDRPQNPAYALFIAATTAEAERKIREIQERGKAA